MPCDGPSGPTGAVFCINTMPLAGERDPGEPAGRPGSHNRRFGKRPHHRDRLRGVVPASLLQELRAEPTGVTQGGARAQTQGMSCGCDGECGHARFVAKAPEPFLTIDNIDFEFPADFPMSRRLYLIVEVDEHTAVLALGGGGDLPLFHVCQSLADADGPIRVPVPGTKKSVYHDNYCRSSIEQIQRDHRALRYALSRPGMPPLRLGLTDLGGQAGFSMCINP